MESEKSVSLKLRDNKPFRILVIGRESAGKTSLLKKLCDSIEDPSYFESILRRKRFCFPYHSSLWTDSFILARGARHKQSVHIQEQPTADHSRGEIPGQFRRRIGQSYSFHRLPRFSQEIERASPCHLVIR
ncbi:hypothetical protein B0H19DRAFT_421899 [Mycena capillaripes]|nr:hypothetical protein B0H19DRAFT_421899 [Mycena capillaripes]